MAIHYNNIKSSRYFSINFLEILEIKQNSFLRCQIFYFALANIRLRRYDSLPRFISLLSGDITVNPQYLTWIAETNSILGKISGNSRMVHFAEINHVLVTYSMLQYIGRVATVKLVPRNCLWYLQSNIDKGGRGISLRIYVRYCLKNKWKIKDAFEKPGIFFILNSLFLMFGICQMVLWLIGVTPWSLWPSKKLKW